MNGGIDEPSRRDLHELLVRHQGGLYGYIASFLPRWDAAEEIFSNVCLILWKKWDRYDATREFMPWARAIAFNEIRNHLRRTRRKSLAFSEDLMAQLAATREQCDELLEARREALGGCLQGLLPDECSQLERFYEGRETGQQIARSLKISAAAFYMRMHRLRDFLHECIDFRLEKEGA
jgi:RNA polymerase sigma-70 factor (ECF subfamily)